MPAATVPLLLHHLGEAWAQANWPLAEKLESVYAVLSRHSASAAEKLHGMPDFSIPFASCCSPAASGRATHPVFDRFSCWEGMVPAGYEADMLGAMIRMRFLAENPPAGQSRYVQTIPPPINEEYFEYIDVLESVLAASGQFTMIELSAGFGRWLIRAACAARKTFGLSSRLIGVEAEPEHFQWMKLHFRDNGFDPDQHQLFEAAVAAQDGEVLFHVGNPAEWYGQAIASPRAVECDTIKRVPAVSLQSLLAPLERVDLIDLDVQGAELEVLEAAANSLNAKVRRIHIGTHGKDLETGCQRSVKTSQVGSIQNQPL